MSLVYSESTVKRKPLLSSGDPEPQLREGELFIYLNSSEDYFVVEHEKTPVSNAFINKNKINYRIKMAAGPFTYEHSDDYLTYDHRKSFRITINLRLEISDAVKLHSAKVSSIKSYLDGIIPSYIASVVENYEMDEINTLRQKLRGIDVFPGLVNDLRTIGLHVAMYNSYVKKDDLQIVHDSRIREAETNLQIDSMIHKNTVIADANEVIFKSEAKMKILKYYEKQLLEGSISPDLLLQMVDDETKAILIPYLNNKGYLEQLKQSESENTLLDDMLNDIKI
ncbi:hypothetical protein [Priestia aryabhattai]|uniref:hypothetical protein n=1 Tax=Priestia aryabhattai TaxID=412384 RepID=UPI003D29A8D9